MFSWQQKRLDSFSSFVLNKATRKYRRLIAGVAFITERLTNMRAHRDPPSSILRFCHVLIVSRHSRHARHHSSDIRVKRLRDRGVHVAERAEKSDGEEEGDCEKIKRNTNEAYVSTVSRSRAHRWDIINCL